MILKEVFTYGMHCHSGTAFQSPAQTNRTNERGKENISLAIYLQIVWQQIKVAMKSFSVACMQLGCNPD